MESTQQNIQLRPLWIKLCPNVLVLLGIVFLFLTWFRYFGTVGGGPGQMIMLGFLLMWFVPLLLLSKAGRKEVGLTLPKRSGWILWAPVVGLVCSFVCYGLGVLLYGSSGQHWFQSVAASFFEDERVLQMPLNALFLMFTIPAMTFSPIGEEILFRGCLQTAVEKQRGIVAGVGLSAFLFATVHLLHHGIVADEAGLKIYWVSGFLWWLLMIGTSVAFSWLRIKYQSLIPAIIGHSFYNLGMNFTIFYLLLEK